MKITALILTMILSIGTIQPASAQEDAATAWDAVARCESGGNYAINTGNSFYGGIQFTIGTWNWVAGQIRPDLVGVRPDLTSKHDQLVMADYLAFEIAGGGLGHWPVCGLQYNHSMPRYGGGASTVVAPTPLAPPVAEAPVATETSPVVAALPRLRWPVGMFDYAFNTAADDHNILLLGWAFDPDSTDTTTVINVEVDGEYHSAIRANKQRPMIGLIHQVEDDHGFIGYVSLDSGEHEICTSVRSLNREGRMDGTDKLLSCKAVVVK
jgi:hypothetical protein